MYVHDNIFRNLQLYVYLGYDKEHTSYHTTAFRQRTGFGSACRSVLHVLGRVEGRDSVSSPRVYWLRVRRLRYSLCLFSGVRRARSLSMFNHNHNNNNNNVGGLRLEQQEPTRSDQHP